MCLAETMEMTFNASQPTIVLLCGGPASGKSSWVKRAINESSKLKTYKVLSTDNWLDNKAKELGKNYVEIFNEYMSIALKHFIEDLYSSISNGENLIIDQTNINSYSRFKKMKLCKKYNKVAVYFELELNDAIQRNCNRARVVPRAVLEKYYKNYTRPTSEEGFNLIIDGNYFNSHLLV